LNIRDANIHKAADFIRVGGDAQRYRRLVRGGPAPDVHNEPRIPDLDVPGRTLAVASAQNAAAKDLFIEISRAIDVGDGDKKCDGEPVAGGASHSSLARFERSLIAPVPMRSAHHGKKYARQP
jgi:hypothetical protein